MPQAVQPGSYSNAYAQQLQKDVMTMAANPTMTLSMLMPNPMMSQADAMIGNSVSSIDTMLATVGVSADPGVNMNPAGSLGLNAPLGMTANPPLGGQAMFGGAGIPAAGNAGFSADMDASMQPGNMMSMVMPMLERLMTMLMSFNGGSPSPNGQTTAPIPDNSGASFDINRTSNSPFQLPPRQFSVFA